MASAPVHSRPFQPLPTQQNTSLVRPPTQAQKVQNGDPPRAVEQTNARHDARSVTEVWMSIMSI